MITYAGGCQSSSVDKLGRVLLNVEDILLESGVGVGVAVAEVHLLLKVAEHIREGETVVTVRLRLIHKNTVPSVVNIFTAALPTNFAFCRIK